MKNERKGPLDQNLIFWDSSEKIFSCAASCRVTVDRTAHHSNNKALRGF